MEDENNNIQHKLILKEWYQGWYQKLKYLYQLKLVWVRLISQSFSLALDFIY